jgi:hypothetical protein
VAESGHTGSFKKGVETMAEVGITEIQAILDSVLTSIGWQHEPDDDGLIGGTQEYSLTPLGALRLRTHAVYLWSNGTVTYHPPKDAGEAGNTVATTEIQSRIMPAFETLGFDLHTDGKCGGVVKYTLPVSKLRMLRRTNFVVKSDGQISFKVGDE